VIRRIGVAQTCQKVCDRIRHRHDSGVAFLAVVPGPGLLRTCFRFGLVG
jgi:hypothetical protein